jgi:hypothetical protein
MLVEFRERDLTRTYEREAVFVANPERMGRALRESAPGSWPASPIGGGGASPHVTSTHLLIAQAGFVPSGATSALAALQDLPVLHYDRQRIPRADTDPHPGPPAATLRDYVAIMIAAAADPARRDALTHWTLIMCAVDPAWAELNIREGDYLHVARFKRMLLGQRRGEHVEYVARIPRVALMICGELWADTNAKLATRDENAATLPGATASSKAPTAQQQDPNSPDASVRVRGSATTGGPPHARRRGRSPISAAPGAA